MIRNRIVIGIQDKDTKVRLPKEENLDMDKTLSICKSNEEVTKQLDFMKQDQSTTNERVNAVGSQAKRPNANGCATKRKIQRRQRTRRRIAADVVDQRSTRKKSVKRTVKHF